MDIVTLALAKRYTKQVVEGKGFLKGDPFTYDDFTEEQLAALKGEKGEPFKYSDFTQAQLNALKGPKGDAFTYNDFTQEQLNGLKGPKGDSFKFEDFTAEQLLSLKGAKGDAFTYSDFTQEQLNGLKGPKGDPFRYSDFTQEQLNSLKGPKGDNFKFEDLTISQKEELRGPKGDSYTITSDDYNEIAARVSIPAQKTKLSELEDDVGYVKLNDIEEFSDKIEDVQVNGVSVVEDKIANIVLGDINTTIGRNFTTTITVGHLEAGTQIKETDLIKDILYKILYKKQISEDTVTIYFGGSDNIPNSIEDLNWMEKVENLDPNDLIQNGISHNIKTGNEETEEGQYATIICSKAIKLIKLTKWTAEGLDILPLDFKTIEKDNYNIYYLDVLTYDLQYGGTNYNFAFEEV